MLGGVEFENDADDILRELLREPGALSAVVSRAGAYAPEEGEAQRHALGSEAELVVATATPLTPELAAAIDRAARDLRACIRRYGLTQVPELHLLGRAPRSRAALLRKATDLLAAVAEMHGAAAAVV